MSIETGTVAAPGPRRRRVLMAATALVSVAGLPPFGVPGGRAQTGPSLGPVPPNSVLPVAMPCADQPGDILGLVLEGAGSPVGAVAVFGQAFRQGDLPQGRGLSVRMADNGRILRSQIDVTTRHRDGSVRYGVVALELPAALPVGDRMGLVLAAGAAAADQPLDPGAALAGRQALVEVAPVEGGRPWRIDLLEQPPRGVGAAARNGFGSGGRPWQHGPVAVQWRVTANIPAAVTGGATSMRLVADVAIRSDQTLWVDVWLRNDIAMRPGGGEAKYVARVLLDGVEALAVSPGRHFQYTALGRSLVAAPGGRPAAWQPHVRPNAAYLADAGATHRYDLTTGVDARVLQGMATLRASPEWQEPFGSRGIAKYMPMAGGRSDIGPMTDWQAAWLITGEPLASSFCQGQAEIAGAPPWQYWDLEGGGDRRGGWLNVKRWPGIWIDGRGGQPPGGLLQQVSGETGWSPDTAHQPDISYFPYLMTGRRAFLDNLVAQAMVNIVSLWPAIRNPPGWPVERGSDMILGYRWNQVRGIAWGLRTLDNAAWIAPDDDPDAAYMRQAIAANWAWYRAQIPGWTDRQGELHGYIEGDNGNNTSFAPWQQDYFASTIALSVRRGSADARAVFLWMTNFLVGRFGVEDRGLAFIDAVANNLPYKERVDGRILRTWSEVGTLVRERGWSVGEDWRGAQGSYAALGMMSLSLCIDEFGLPAARRAYDRMVELRPRYAQPIHMATNPALNIVARDMQRFASRIRACTRSAPPRG